MSMTLVSTQETESQMEPLEIRDRRYRLQQRIDELDAEEDRDQIEVLEKQVEELQEICPHPDEHRQEDDDEGIWRCRDCDLRGDLPGADADEESDEAEEEESSEAEEEESDEAEEEA